MSDLAASTPSSLEHQPVAVAPALPAVRKSLPVPRRDLRRPRKFCEIDNP